MKNFNYNIPTKVLFGEGKVKELGKEIKKYGNKVLIVYGKGSIKRTGLYDKVVNILEESGIEKFELAGVDPNPRIESVYEGAKICRENEIALVLAVGGGSTIDCSKAIAAQTNYEGDIWTDMYQTGDTRGLKDVLPVATILTIAATGSEMNGNSVISKMDVNDKRPIGSDLLRPVFSILDPTLTYTLPKKHLAAGIVDILSHIFEQYFSPDKEGFLQNRVMEGLMKTIIHYGPKAMENPEDYEARANIMWTGSLALNGLISYGKVSTDWATHGIEHELSAKYDITHGIGLAILTPYWMEYVLDKDNVHRFVEYGENVWGISGKDDMETAKMAIDKTKGFFISLDMPTRLSEIGIDDSKFEIMAEDATKFSTLGSMKKLNKSDVLEIYIRAL